MNDTPIEKVPEGVKSLKFAFEFEYSAKGEVERADTIILKAPGLALMDVENKITSNVFKAMAAISSGRTKEDLAESAKDKKLTKKQQAEAEADLQKASLQYLAMGLSTKDYNEFIFYVKRVLTGNSDLACIQDLDGNETAYGLNDLFWAQLEKQDRLKSVRRIITAFTGFFIIALMGQMENG